MKKSIISLLIVLLLCGITFMGYKQYSNYKDLELMKEKLKLEKLQSKEHSKKDTAQKTKDKNKDKSKGTTEKTSPESQTLNTVEQSNEPIQENSSIQQPEQNSQQNNINTDNSADPSRPSATQNKCVPSIMSDTGCIYVTPEEYDKAMAEIEQKNKEIQEAQSETE